MRFLDLKSNNEFNPNSSEWPKQAWVEEAFVGFKVIRKEDKVIAEEPELVWDLNDFLETVNRNSSLKALFAVAQNIVRDPDDFGGNLRIKTWFCDKPRLVFQVAYEPVNQ